jgi:hypothetical protein
VFLIAAISLCQIGPPAQSPKDSTQGWPGLVSKRTTTRVDLSACLTLSLSLLRAAHPSCEQCFRFADRETMCSVSRAPCELWNEMRRNATLFQSREEKEKKRKRSSSQIDWWSVAAIDQTKDCHPTHMVRRPHSAQVPQHPPRGRHPAVWGTR